MTDLTYNPFTEALEEMILEPVKNEEKAQIKFQDYPTYPPQDPSLFPLYERLCYHLQKIHQEAAKNRFNDLQLYS